MKETFIKVTKNMICNLIIISLISIVLKKHICLFICIPLFLTDNYFLKIEYWYIFINQFKSNVIMKRINFNQRPTPVARRSSRATCENSTERLWWLVVTVSVPSGFSAWCCSESVGMPLFPPEPLSCALLWS